MILHKEAAYREGMNMLVAGADGGTMRLDFGIVSLGAGGVWEDSTDKERALLLIRGDVRFEWAGVRREAGRRSCLDEPPEVLHVPSGMPVRIVAGECGAELCYEACINEGAFDPVYYGADDIGSDVFGAGVLNETSIRTVRTVFDGETAPFSNMVLGEVINHPGKWSSYPPHDHPHPEIYHYRLFPRQGFGVSLLEDEAHVIRDGSTSLIAPDKTHSQVAAAGYAMYYIWMISHLPGNRWLPSTRYFREEHRWLLASDVTIWPERPFEETT